MTSSPVRRALPALVALALVGCGSSGSGASDLVGDWVLDPDSLSVDVPDDVVVTASFTDEGVSGNAGCNTYTGDYTADDAGHLILGVLATTRMACIPEVGAVEAAYLEQLSIVSGFDIDGGHLELSDTTGTTILRYDEG